MVNKNKDKNIDIDRLKERIKELEDKVAELRAENFKIRSTMINLETLKIMMQFSGRNIINAYGLLCRENNHSCKNCEMHKKFSNLNNLFNDPKKNCILHLIQCPDEVYDVLSNFWEKEVKKEDL